MGHATPEELVDLAAELAVIRSWPEIKETSRNVFYVKRTPFLHFPTKDGRRFADVRRGLAWGPRLEVPLPASKKARAVFFEAVESAYRETFDAVVAPKKAKD